ncbi:LysR family transcriptional regulator [Litorimonas sp. RW-G-Af-16]|uniref:LysR family transcriptional regulator n=1 Tax=Litorimonas sp. RW-G-Af-16 TaxID=3241168 RepID=UPI00390C40E0
MLDLKDIEYVFAISKAGGIQKAADKIGLSQPALSKRIQNLEHRLQLRLFDRLAKGMRLTEAGELFLAEGLKLIAHTQDFQSKLNDHKGGKGGLVSIGMKPGLEDAFFRRSIVQFTQEFPETNLQITIDSTPALADKIKNGDIDFAMGALGYADDKGGELVLTDDLEFEPYFNIPLEVIVRKNHPVLDQLDDPLALFDYPIICPTPPLDLFENLKASYQQKGNPISRPHIQVDDYAIIYELVERSDMWTATFASNHTKLELADKFTMLGQSDLLPPLTIGLVKRKTWAISPSAAKLIQIMQVHAREWAIP